MRNILVVGLTVGSLYVVAHAQARLGTLADEAAIKKSREGTVAAWNKHDAKAFAATMAADADHANINGRFHGSAEIEKSFADNFAGVNKTATLRDDSIDVRFLTSDVAVLTTEEIVTGRTDGVVAKSIATSVYVKRSGNWVRVVSRSIRMP